MRSWKELHLAEEALGGLSAGVLGTVIGFPLDLVKTRMQTAKTTSNNGIPLSILSVGRSIVRTEGVSALYKGLLPPLISLSILNTITFAQYSLFRDVYSASAGWDVRNAIAGISCSPIGSMVSTIENLVKTQMQLDNITKKQYKSSLHCIQTLVESHGIRIIYTGHVVNTIREATFLGNYFFVYEGLRELFLNHHALVGSSDAGGTSAKIAVPVAGGLAGAFSWFISFPLDCIRAGVQGQTLVAGQSRQSAIQVCRSLVEDRGIRGLYSGASASILRAFLVSGSRFSAYEGALWLLRGGRDLRRHEDEL